MSGLASGIGRVFQSVGNAATRVASSVLGVGAATTTAGIATGAGSMASGGLNGFLSNLTGNGVMGNIVSGAIKQAGYGAVLGGITGMVTGQGFGKGALMGAAGGALTGGLMAGMRTQPTGTLQADTPTGLAPSGASMAAANPSMPTGGSYMMTGPGQAAATAARTATASSTVPQGGGLLAALTKPETLGQALAGAGQGAGQWFTMKTKVDAEKDMQERELGYLRDKDQRVQDSYSVSDSSFATPPGTKRMRYDYDPAQGKIVMVNA